MRLFAIVTLLIGSFVVNLAAQPADLIPSSILLFPKVDSRDGTGKGTIVSVSNINASRIVSPTNNYRAGDVQLHYYYIEGAGAFQQRVQPQGVPDSERHVDRTGRDP